MPEVPSDEQLVAQNAALTVLAADVQEANQALTDRMDHYCTASMNAEKTCCASPRTSPSRSTTTRPKRDIRTVEIQQKISGGWRSETGARAFLTVRPYLSTAPKDHRAGLDVLRELFTGNPWLPAATGASWTPPTTGASGPPT